MQRDTGPTKYVRVHVCFSKILMLTSSDLSKWRETSGARKRHIEKFVYAYSPCVYMLTGHGQLCANYPVTVPLNMVISVKPSAPDMRSELLNNRNPIYIRLTHIIPPVRSFGFCTQTYPFTS